MQSHREVEIKLRVADVPATRRRLRELGAQAGKRQHETNTLFDTPTAALRKRGHMLRLRRVGGRWVVTRKGPGKPSAGSRRYKERQEREWTIRRPAPLLAELARRGLRPTFRYEKYRTKFRWPLQKNLDVLLDDTPIGFFLELEGSKRQIDRVARRLGYGPVDYLTSSYAGLYLADCRRRGVRPSHMLFPRPRRAKK